MPQVLISLIILIFQSDHIPAQIDYCNKICEVCVVDTVSCKKGSFDQIPNQMSSTIKRFILQDQIFSQNYLSRINFTALSPPKVTLETLIIRNSNIKVIKTQTFIDLKNLKTLDLSFNYDLLIQSRSFDGLNISYLRLDYNENIKFEMSSFQGLYVVSLHISHSKISEIPFSLLEPVLPSLKKLFLDNNLLITIDSRYQVPFKNFDVLNLEYNPISCTCSMKWLTDVYLYRGKNGKFVQNAFSDNVENSPTCVEPHFMKGKYLHRLSSSAFLCDPPTLTQLKIDFRSTKQTELSCTASQNINEASMSVEWFSGILEGLSKRLSSILNLTQKTKSYVKEYTNSFLVVKKNSTDTFQCIAKNINGNTTATVRINWPPLERLTDQYTNVDESSNDGFQKPNDENYLFQKRFTLLEMLGAVIGTFSLTLFIFFLIYKIVFINRQLNRKMIQPPNGYTTYEAAVYSDSQTYDVPGNSYAQSILLPMPHLSSTPDHFLDFKTQKKFYQTT